MRAEHFLYFNNSRIWGECLVPVRCIAPLPPPGDLGCSSFWDGGSGVADFLLIVFSDGRSLWLFYVLLYVTLCLF